LVFFNKFEDQKQNKRMNEVSNQNHNFKNNILNSDFLESSQLEEFEREEYPGRVNTQGKNSIKNDSKERLKNDLMPNNYDQSKNIFCIFKIFIRFKIEIKQMY